MGRSASRSRPCVLRHPGRVDSPVEFEHLPDSVGTVQASLSPHRVEFGLDLFDLLGASSVLDVGEHRTRGIAARVLVRDGERGLRFHELGKASAEELVEVARWTYEALTRVRARHGRSLEGCGCCEGCSRSTS